MADRMIAGFPVSCTANHSQPNEIFIRELVIVFQGRWIYAGFSIIIFPEGYSLFWGTCKLVKISI